MENTNFNVEEIKANGFRIPCNDEPDFYHMAKQNGRQARQFINADGWEGLYVEYGTNTIIYFYGGDYAYLIED